MSSPDPAEPQPSGPEVPAPPVQAPVAAGKPAPLAAARLWAAALAAGLVACLTAWFAGEAVIRANPPRISVLKGMGGPVSAVSPADRRANMTQNASLAYAALGGWLGLTLGLAGGLARGSVRSGVRAALLGLVLGLGLGGAATRLLVPAYYRFEDRYQEQASANLTVPLLIHGGIWAAAGAAGGLAFGLGIGGRSRPARAALGGLLGGAAGAAVYELLGAFLFPAAQTVQPISAEWLTRLLAYAAVALLAASGAAFAVADLERTAARASKIA